MIVKTSQQWLNIDGKNAFECPLRLGLYLKVSLWQGAICHVWIQTLATFTKTTTKISNLLHTNLFSQIPKIEPPTPSRPAP